MSQLVSTVVRFASQQRNVPEEAITKTPELMEIINYLCEDKMADLSASYEMAVLALSIFDKQNEIAKQAEEARQAEIKAYWNKKLAEATK